MAGELRRGLSGASRALDAPIGADLESLIAGADLPEIAGSDAIGALAVRLDRETAGVARVAWADRSRADGGERGLAPAPR